MMTTDEFMEKLKKMSIEQGFELEIKKGNGAFSCNDIKFHFAYILKNFDKEPSRVFLTYELSSCRKKIFGLYGDGDSGDTPNHILRFFISNIDLIQERHFAGGALQLYVTPNDFFKLKF